MSYAKPTQSRKIVELERVFVHPDPKKARLRRHLARPGERDVFPLADSRKSRPRDARCVEDYKLGIICALDIELKAVRALFDETHDEKLPICVDDDNYYALGCMAKQNIVAACLPLGAYGTNPAAIVATHMRRSFPALRFAWVMLWSARPAADIRVFCHMT